MIEQYRKKPVVIEAVIWDGSEIKLQYLKDWTKNSVRMLDSGQLIITTLEDGENGEAVHVASPHDYIIKGVAGEFYACKPDIFEATYEAA